MGRLSVTINDKPFEDEFDSLEELNGFYIAARVLLEQFEGEKVHVRYEVEYNGDTFGHESVNQKKNLSILIPIQVSIYRMRLKKLNQ